MANNCQTLAQQLCDCLFSHKLLWQVRFASEITVFGPISAPDKLRFQGGARGEAIIRGEALINKMTRTLALWPGKEKNILEN